MDKLPLIEMESLKTLTKVDSFQDELLIAELDGTLLEHENDECEEKDFSTPVRMNALVIVITSQGSSDFSLDYAPYSTGANKLMTIFPSHTVQLLNVSPDFKATMVVISKHFIDTWIDKKSPSMLNYLKLVKNPLTQLEKNETTVLLEIIRGLQLKIRNRVHFLQKEALQIGLISFLIELGNIFMSKKDGIMAQPLTRKEELLNQFLELLFNHCKEEHQVAFYADKLCISPQYLSLILKERTGKSANKWIDEALMTEAKILLKSPNITVQQVANALNFSDQSTFGKFFKKHQKVSPLEYRKS